MSEALTSGDAAALFFLPSAGDAEEEEAEVDASPDALSFFAGGAGVGVGVGAEMGAGIAEKAKAGPRSAPQAPRVQETLISRAV